jgi:hypothetical protein
LSFKFEGAIIIVMDVLYVYSLRYIKVEGDIYKPFGGGAIDNFEGD